MRNEILLNNGVSMPALGLGTSEPLYGVKLPPKNDGILGRIHRRCVYERYRIPRYHKMNQCIQQAIQCGYRLIDTSAAYGNEKIIGHAIRQSGIDRKELFITTRISNRQQEQSDVRASLQASMQKLGVSYIDLYMFHWPVPDLFLDIWKQMEELYHEGLAKAIGVANCHQHHIEQILESGSVVPAVNQFEIHPLMSQKPLTEYCKSEGIAVEAYTPLGRNHEKLANSNVLQKIANAHHKSIQQIILRWHLQNGVIPIPRSSNTQRIKKNVEIFDFVLSEAEIRSIDDINENMRLRYDPDNCDFSKL